MARAMPRLGDAPTRPDGPGTFRVPTSTDVLLARETREVYGERREEEASGIGLATPAADVLPQENPGPEAGEEAEVPDPFTDADALGELEHELTTLAAHIAAATHRFLVLLADFDRRRGWELGGHRSCAHWLQVATAMDLRTARSRVRVARKLKGLPRTGEAMSRGELSFSQVRALSRVATPECEEELIEYARSTTVSELERFVRTWRTMSRADEESLERERYRLRRFSVVPDSEGMYVVKGRVTAEVGAVLMRAIDAAGDALFCAEAAEETMPKQRRADALGLVAERALAAGFGGSGSAEPPESAEDGSREPSTEPDVDTDPGSHEPGERSDAAMGDETSPGNPAPISGSRAERYQVILHVKAESSHLEDGTGLSPESSRRLCCDASVVTVSRDPDGSVLDVGRRTRTIPPALRRALEVRDEGCRFPGCGLRFTDGHHLKHWQDGGETKLDNLLLLCRYHHRLVHEGGWRVEFWGKEQHAAFIDPNGGIHMDTTSTGASGRKSEGPGEIAGLELANDRPTPGLPDDPVDSLIEGHESAGIAPTAWTLWAEHARAADVPFALRAQALEALDAAHFGV